MLHPRAKREFLRDVRNIRQSLKILNSVENVRVTTFSLLGGGYKCDLSLGMLPTAEQEKIISHIENVLETHKGYLLQRLNENKVDIDEQ